MIHKEKIFGFLITSSEMTTPNACKMKAFFEK